MPTNIRKLNLGCGTDIRSDWINLDRIALPGVDVVHNLDQLPLPFESGSMDRVDVKDVLEHMEYISLIRDIHRLLRPGGELHIQVPHFSSVYNYIDPTHLKKFSIRTFEFFLPRSDFGREYYFDFSFSEIKERHIYFPWGWALIRRLVEWVVNRNHEAQFHFEYSAFCYLFPAGNIQVTLIK